MDYHIDLKTKEDGTPLKVSVTFHVPNTEDQTEYVSVLGLGRNGRPNPFHPEEQKLESETFERARQVAIEVFEAAHSITAPPTLMPLPQWLRRYPCRLGELFDRRLVWSEPNVPPLHVWITTPQAERLMSDGWGESKGAWHLPLLQVGFCRDTGNGWSVGLDRLFVPMERTGQEGE